MEQIHHIKFQDIESIPNLVKDFLNGHIPNFSTELFSLKNFELKIKNKEKNYTPEQRNTLHSALNKQMKNLQLSDKQKDNLKKIKTNNTFTITTGHQLNLFSGPMFFIYKILQTIKTADYLAKNFPNQHFVPVFWMATEDHDFEEINHFRTENHYYEITEPSGGAVGKIIVNDQKFIPTFEEEFKDHIFGTELIQLMKKAYTKDKTLAEATRFLVNELFSDYGLLILDGDDASLKSEMKTIFKEELLNQKLIKSTKNKVNWLIENYGKTQVNPREINLFYLSKTRNRIEKQGEFYQVLNENITFTEAEILDQLEMHPEHFSPNALLRPIYQEKILPNLAYIGGNAEIMYWLELQDFFTEISLNFPILIPRNSLLFLSEKILKKSEKLNLNIGDFFKNFAQIINEKMLENHPLKNLISEKESEIQLLFKEIKNKAYTTDPSFLNLVEAEETRQLKAFKRMKKRLLKAEKIKEKEKLSRLELLFLKVHPNGQWQERTLNFSVFYSDFGKDWLQNCYKTIDVTKSELNIIKI